MHHRLTHILLFITLAAGCSKIEKLPPEPRIEYRDFTVFDSTDILGNPIKAGRLEFYFEDGDGDVGLQQPVEEEKDSINLFFSLYRKTQGSFAPVDEDDPVFPSGYRIPYMEREGQNKTLKGTVEVLFFYLFWEETDTLRYDFYITDRAGHESNQESTDEITFTGEEEIEPQI